MKSDSTFQLETAAWPAFLVEVGGTIRHANQAATSFFGPKLEGEALSLGALWAEPDESAEQFLARCERSAPPVIPIRYNGKGGTIVTFATYICSPRDVQTRFIFQLINEYPESAEINRDAMVLGETEAKPASSDTTLIRRQKLDCALQLTRTVTLDFNNALTAILGHTSMLLGKVEPDHAWRSSLLEIEKAAAKAAEITNHLATFSRQEKESPQHASGNLNSVVRHVTDAVKKTASDQVTWALELTHHLYTVKFDEAKLQQAFCKIVENAVEALGASGCITVSSRNLEITQTTQDRTAQLEPGAYVCICISDDGVGIEASVLDRLFEPFFTTKENHRGLGLAWVYGIITNHRGGVAVSSEPGQGTSVRVYLPASQKIVADTSLLAANSGTPHTILMVDDEDLVLTMGQTILSNFGYKVLTATSGTQALELITASDSPIDLVITDLVMPQMSGRELIEQLQLRLPGIPILCTSGYVRPAGAEDTESYLAKPFASHELLLRVKQILSPANSEAA